MHGPATGAVHGPARPGPRFANQLSRSLPLCETARMTQAPGFCTVCIALLAVGIGANATIFSLINAFLFRPIALEEPDRLAGIYNGHRTNPDDWRGFDGARYQTVRQNATSFADVLAHRFTPVGLSEATLTRPAFAEFVSTNYFSVLGIRPYRGRGLSDGEDAAPIAIASYAYWARTGFDPALIGTTVRVNRTEVTIAGIMPEGFTGLTAMLSPDLWLPLAELLDEPASGQIGPRGPGQNATLLLVGRLKRGITVQAANTQLELLSVQLEQSFPETFTSRYLTAEKLPRLAMNVRPIRQNATLTTVPAMLMLVTIAVQFIICLNLGNLMLARAIPAPGDLNPARRGRQPSKDIAPAAD